MSSSPVPASTAAVAPTKDLDKAEKSTLGGFISGLVGKLGINLVTKAVPRAALPLRFAAAAIELYKVASPVVRDLLDRLNGKTPQPAPVPSKTPSTATAPVPAATTRAAAPMARTAMLADPVLGEQLSRLAQLGGLSAIQRAAAEARMPVEPVQVASLYLSGARAALEDGLVKAQSVMERTGDFDSAFKELRPYLTDAKLSVRDLSVLLDNQRSPEDRAQAAARIFDDLTRPTAPERTAAPSQSEEPANRTPDTVSHYLPSIVDRLSASLEDALRSVPMADFAREPVVPDVLSRPPMINSAGPDHLR